jgi:hypothetical protein
MKTGGGFQSLMGTLFNSHQQRDPVPEFRRKTAGIAIPLRLSLSRNLRKFFNHSELLFD